MKIQWQSMDHTKYSQRDHQGKGVVKFNVLKVKKEKK